MCGRYSITVTIDELMLRYEVDAGATPFHLPRYNIAPSQGVPAIINDGSRNRIGELRWGLIPPWADSPKIGFTMINARSETAAVKPAFKAALSRRRCIIPADGFYEWKRTSAGKQPMRIVMKSRSIFSMAGLYETWLSPEGVKISSCTIMTTEPNELMSAIHDRMPVILRPEDEASWLDRGAREPKDIEALLRPYRSSEMEAYPVSPDVGNVKNDSPQLIEAFSSGEQLKLW